MTRLAAWLVGLPLIIAVSFVHPHLLATSAVAGLIGSAYAFMRRPLPFLSVVLAPLLAVMWIAYARTWTSLAFGIGASWGGDLAFLPLEMALGIGPFILAVFVYAVCRFSGFPRASSAWHAVAAVAFALFTVIGTVAVFLHKHGVGVEQFVPAVLSHFQAQGLTHDSIYVPSSGKAVLDSCASSVVAVEHDLTIPYAAVRALPAWTENEDLISEIRKSYGDRNPPIIRFLETGDLLVRSEHNQGDLLRKGPAIETRLMHDIYIRFASIRLTAGGVFPKSGSTLILDAPADCVIETTPTFLASTEIDGRELLSIPIGYPRSDFNPFRVTELLHAQREVAVTVLNEGVDPRWAPTLRYVLTWQSQVLLLVIAGFVTFSCIRQLRQRFQAQASTR